ncbi:hypothetical protein Tco_0440150 [Tanacetum coccineum]
MGVVAYAVNGATQEVETWAEVGDCGGCEGFDGDEDDARCKMKMVGFFKRLVVLFKRLVLLFKGNEVTGS